MQDLDINISNYGLHDILNLFSIPAAFTDVHLKHAKRVVLKTHPDKSNLPKEYFLFFTQAYRILYQIYTMRHEKAQGYEHADTYRDLIASSSSGSAAGSMGLGDTSSGAGTGSSADEVYAHASKLSAMSPSDFNHWFNTAFERYRVPDEEGDGGYEDWFRNGADSERAGDDGPVSKTQWAASLESARNRMMALVPASASEPAALSSSSSSSLWSSSAASLQYEDLKRAHTETLLPVTETDIHSVTSSRCKSVQELRTSRTAAEASFAPMSKTEAMRALDREKEADAEQCTHRAYLMAKQDEIARDMNRRFMKEFKTIGN
jgi:hypothetical protein